MIITAVTIQKLSQAQTARRYGLSRSHVSRVMARYRAEGQAALEPRSRAPHTSPTATPLVVVEAVLAERDRLVAAGHDAGPETISAYLARGNIKISRATTARILTRHARVTPQPKKKPRSALHHFEADLPNECWQSDFTHYRLATGVDTEIITWLDDHSRMALHVSVHERITAQIVLTTFRSAYAEHGIPASTLTDNGMVYTVRFASQKVHGGRTAFEAELARLGVIQKNGRGGHPQTQGKVERFQQTLKRWLSARPLPATIAELQSLLDEFALIYNTERTHRALPPATTPAQAYTGRPKAGPTGAAEHFRIRRDIIDQFGKLTLRHGSRLHHLGVGRTHAHTPVLILITPTTVTVISKTGHHLLSTHIIDPDTNYWRNQQKNPGRWPG